MKSKIAIVGCSNGQLKSYYEKIELLDKTLREMGLIPVYSKCIYERGAVFSGSAKERAQELNNFYKDDAIKGIFDISGGDIANEILPYIDFSYIAERSNIEFWGYSDLTTIINAIYTKTGKTSVLYQIRNLIYEDKENQVNNFKKTFLYDKKDLFSFECQFIRGREMKGKVIGGNIRCLLKLAGTEYWPDMENKVLFLESYGGGVALMSTYFAQLQQLGAFSKVKGVLLGTFTAMEKDAIVPTISELVLRYINSDIAIAKTYNIGHNVDSRAIRIGEEIILTKQLQCQSIRHSL